jgi:hypothetical protein
LPHYRQVNPFVKGYSWLKVAELSSELISELAIPCEQDEEVAEATLPPSEAHWEGTLDSNHEEESTIEHSNEERYT